MRTFFPSCKQIGQFYVFIWLGAWRHARGSWFIFRGTPDWFVHLMAFPPAKDPKMEEVTMLAKEEWKLRKRRRNQKRGSQ